MVMRSIEGSWKTAFIPMCYFAFLSSSSSCFLSSSDMFDLSLFKLSSYGILKKINTPDTNENKAAIYIPTSQG